MATGGGGGGYHGHGGLNDEDDEFACLPWRRMSPLVFDELRQRTSASLAAFSNSAAAVGAEDEMMSNDGYIWEDDIVGDQPNSAGAALCPVLGGAPGYPDFSDYHQQVAAEDVGEEVVEEEAELTGWRGYNQNLAMLSLGLQVLQAQRMPVTQATQTLQQQRHQGRPSVSSATSAAASASRASAQLSAWLASVYAADEVAAAAAGVGIRQPPPLNSPASPAASIAGGGGGSAASRSGQQHRRRQQQQQPQHLDDSTVTSTCALTDLDDLDSLDGAGFGIAGEPQADDPDQLSQALLRMSANPADCSRLRQGQPYSLVLPLLYGPETRDPCPESRCPSPHANLPPRQVRDRAAQILANLADCPEAGAKEKLILCHLEQVRVYCDAVRATLCRCGQLTSPTSPPPSAAVLDDLRDRCCSSLSVLLELSYSDTDRPAIAELGGVECLSDLLLVDFCHTQYRPPPCSQFLRRYAASALTNLSYGDAACKRRVCLRAPAVWSLVEQLKSPPGVQQPPAEEELCQVTAAVIRNLSWQADAECRAVLGRLGAAGVLARAALQVRRESTLRSLLSALWNLSAHSTANKEAICAVPGSLGLLCACLTCNHSLAETGGGVLRNISSVVAVREDLRAAVRPAFPVLLTQLRSASLTVVANACGILWNLSSNHLADQRLLTRLGAVPMLRCLVQSKHKVIRLASASALKNLVSARLHDSAELPPPPPQHHATHNNPRIGSTGSSGSSNAGNRSRSSSGSSQQANLLGGRQQMTTAARSSSAAPSASSSASKPAPAAQAASSAVAAGSSGSPRPLLCSPQRSASQDSLRSAVSDVTHDRANQQPLSASVHYNSSGRSELTLPQCVRLAGAVGGPPDEEEEGSSGGPILECAVNCGAGTATTVAATPPRAPAASAAVSAPASAQGGSVQPTPLVFSRGSSGHSLDSVGLDSLRSSRASSYSAGTGGRSAGPPLSPSCLPDTPSEQMPLPQPPEQQPQQLRQIQRQTLPQRIPGASRHRHVAGSCGSKTSSSAASSSSRDEDDGLDSQILQDCIRSGMPPAKPRTTRAAAAAAVSAKAIATTDDRPTVFHVEHTPSPPSSVDLNYGGDEQHQQQNLALKASLPSTRPLVGDNDIDDMDDIENDNNVLENDDDEVEEPDVALALDDEDEAVLDMDINVGIGEEEDDAIANAIVEEDDDVASVSQGGAARVAPTAASRSDEKTVTYKTEDTPAHFSYRTSAQTSSRSSSCSSDNADLLLEACISSAMPKKQQQQQQQAAAAARAKPTASSASFIAANADIGDSSSNASDSSSISSNAGSNNKASFFWIGFDGGKQQPQQQQQLAEALDNREAGPSKPRTQQALPTVSAASQQQARLPPPAPPRQPAPGSSSSSSSSNKLHLVHQQHRLACRLHAGTDRRLYTLTEERSSPSPVELRDADRQSSSGGSRTSAEAPGRPIDSRTFSIHSDEEPVAGQLTLELSDIDTSDLSGSSMEIDAAAIRESPHASTANAGLAGYNSRKGTDLVDASQDTDTDLDLSDEDDDGDATGILFGLAKPESTPTPPPPPPIPIASVRQSLEGSAASRLPAPKPLVARTSWVPVSPSALASRLPTPATVSGAKRPSVGGEAKPSVIPAPKLTPTPSKLPASAGSWIPAPLSATKQQQQQQQQQQPGASSMLTGGGKPLGIVAPTPARSSIPAPSFSPLSIGASASGAAAASVGGGRRSKDSGFSAGSSPAGSLDSGSPAQRFTLQVTTSSASPSSASGSSLLRRQQSPITFNLTISSGGGGDSEAASTICDDDVDEVSVDIIDDDASSSFAPPESPTDSSATSAAGIGRARIVKRPKSADSAPGPPRKLVGGCGGRGGSIGRGRVSSIGGSPVRQPLSIRRANATSVRLNKSAVARLGGGVTNGSPCTAQQQPQQQQRQLHMQQPMQQNSQQQTQREKQKKLSQRQEKHEQRRQQQQQKQLPQRQQKQDLPEQQKQLPQRQQKQELPEQQKQLPQRQQKQDLPEQQKQLPQRQQKQDLPEQQKQLPQRQQKQDLPEQQKQLPQRQQKQELPEQQKQLPQRQQKQDLPEQQKQLPQRQQKQDLPEQQKQLPQRQQKQELPEQQKQLPQRQQKQDLPEQQKQLPQRQQKQDLPEQQKQLPQRQQKQDLPEQQKQLPQRQQKQELPEQQKQLPQRQQKQELPEQQKQLPQRQQKQEQEQFKPSAQKPTGAAGRSAVKPAVRKPSSSQQQQQQQSSALTDSVTTSSSISSSESGAIWITKEEVAEVLCRTPALVS